MSIDQTRRPGRTRAGWARRLTYWPMLLGPAAVGAVVLARVLLAPSIFGQLDVMLEVIAPFLLIPPVMLYAARSAVTRNPLYAILTFTAGTLLCREIHFAGTDVLVYVCLALAGGWAFAWRRRLAEPLRDWRHTSWLLATIATYALGLLIDRRVFRFVPGEQAIHSKLEEGVETMGHLVFILTSIVGSWRRHLLPGKPDGPRKAEEA